MGITYYSTPVNGFASLYISARTKEERVYSASEVARLPNLLKGHPHFEEWQLRKKSAARFLDYIRDKKTPLKILDIGCGNGWFSHLMSTIAGTEVIGLDVNETELQQADHVFQKPNLSFAYGDVFKNTELHTRRFDLIVFNSCFQYFKDAKTILALADGLLEKKGEIHLIDTPFYTNATVENARQRSQAYYQKLGFPEMATHYFHHQLEDLGQYKILYSPRAAFLRYLKKDSPFPWLLIEKQNPEHYI